MAGFLRLKRRIYTPFTNTDANAQAQGTSKLASNKIKLNARDQGPLTAVDLTAGVPSIGKVARQLAKTTQSEDGDKGRDCFMRKREPFRPSTGGEEHHATENAWGSSWISE